MNETVYVVLNLYEEVSWGSSPSITPLVFTTKEKRDEYIENWKKQHENFKLSSSNPLTYINGDWFYTLELYDIPLNTDYKWDTNIKY